MNDEKYEFDIYMQQILLGCMLKDGYFLRQCSGLIKPNYFKDECHDAICKIVLELFEKYHQVPKQECIEQEIKERHSDNVDRMDAVLYELKTIVNGYEVGMDSREYLIDKVNEFAKIQTLREAIVETTDILGKKIDNKWNKIYTILNTALNVDKKLDDGLDYFQTVADRYKRMLESKETGEVFTTGFKQIDLSLQAGGICRGEMISFMGNSGAGKSNLLVKASVANIALGYKVLYMSLEMDADKLASRTDALLTSCNINELLINSDTVISAIGEQVAEYKDKRRLIIKQFPGGTITVKDIRAYLAQLEVDGFVPDVLVLDYLGEMSFDISRNHALHQLMYYTVRDLRALAVENDIAIYTAIQANRSGRSAMEADGVLQDENIAASYDIVKPLDGLYSINQNKGEKNAGVGRISIAKQRAGKSGFFFHFRNMPNLDMVEITKDKYESLMNSAVNMISNKFKPNG